MNHLSTAGFLPSTVSSTNITETLHITCVLGPGARKSLWAITLRDSHSGVFRLKEIAVLESVGLMHEVVPDFVGKVRFKSPKTMGVSISCTYSSLG